MICHARGRKQPPALLGLDGFRAARRHEAVFAFSVRKAVRADIEKEVDRLFYAARGGYVGKALRRLDIQHAPRGIGAHDAHQAVPHSALAEAQHGRIELHRPARVEKEAQLFAFVIHVVFQHGPKARERNAVQGHVPRLHPDAPCGHAAENVVRDASGDRRVRRLLLPSARMWSAAAHAAEGTRLFMKTRNSEGDMSSGEDDWISGMMATRIETGRPMRAARRVS
ncbi:MAG: hypothetical protein K6F46_09715 [Desulfovibrio sp.]|nr:hypothetical protein [Desulfovibrio sp.]